jgi:hypothetical protein
VKLYYNILVYKACKLIVPFCYRISLAIPRNEDKSGYDKCRMYAVNFTDMWNKGIREGNLSWPTISCTHGWEFNYTDIPYPTIASEVRLNKLVPCTIL